MKRFLGVDEWKIIQSGWEPENIRIIESIFSLGNGRMGLRGNFEEGYSGDSLQGSYFAGIYYPDKTKVGWWKNGYPEYFAKVLNATNWIAIGLSWNGSKVDLQDQVPANFTMELDMEHGILRRTFDLNFPDDSCLRFRFERFTSMQRKEAGIIRMDVSVIKGSGNLEVSPALDLDVQNEDANYEEKFWESLEDCATLPYPYVSGRTKKSGFALLSAMAVHHQVNGQEWNDQWHTFSREKYVAITQHIPLAEGDQYSLTKFTAHINSLYSEEAMFRQKAEAVLHGLVSEGYDRLLEEHITWWNKKWRDGDIVIEGDAEAQQGIRFNIFQLHQTYTGDDPRLNIGPKGFTGEKYGGSTYWDTEAYCIPFFLSTAPKEVSKNLLVYRYRHLSKAIDNAQKLGFSGGAALYPMVTMNGEECHNEWEITFEEIHRNGAIAYAIHDYIRYTGDHHYLMEYGLEVLIGISRFWSQRVNWSDAKGKYVILGVTGPNEYENNVNNNWYSNYIAQWCLKYTLRAIEQVQSNDPKRWAKIVSSLNWNNSEAARWVEIIEGMYLPFDEKRQVYLQQDGFLDKELMTVDQLSHEHKPLNQKWSWDRILRSCFIKQADVLQGLYFFEEYFSREEIRRNFDFYEPMTVHESSLSPCIHSILACSLEKTDKAYEMYLRTSRLDLDDYNNDTEDGLHITSMAGTWMAVVKGFGGLRVKDNLLHLQPHLPEKWRSLTFNILFRGIRLNVKIDHSGTKVTNNSDRQIELKVNGSMLIAYPQKELTIS